MKEQISGKEQINGKWKWNSSRNGTPGVIPGCSGRYLTGISGTDRYLKRDKNDAVLFRFFTWNETFRPFRPKRNGINNLGFILLYFFFNAKCFHALLSKNRVKECSCHKHYYQLSLTCILFVVWWTFRLFPVVIVREMLYHYYNILKCVNHPHLLWMVIITWFVGK